MAIVQDVVLGVTGFLEFEFYAGRAYSFNERGITSQIIQIIYGSERVSKFECEKHHPLLNDGIRRGRPKSVDIHWISEKNGTGTGNWLEYKWFGFSTPSVDSILEDIYRLAIIAQAGLGRTYFFAFGIKRSIRPFLASEKNKRTDGKHEIIRYSKERFPVLKPSHIVHESVSKIRNKIGPHSLPDSVSLDSPFSTATDTLYPSRCCGFGFEIR